MPPEDQTNGNTPGEFEDSAMARTTEFKKDSSGLSGVSDMFGLRGSPSGASKTDTSRSASHTTGFTSSGLAPTSLYVPLPDDATPRTLQGRYRLVAELGMGGMGVTYRAWDSRDGVPVVIKMPRKDVRTNPEIMDRFNREVRTMLELSHEHIVPITDHGEEEGCPFVAMRFLPGGSLSEYRGRDETGKAARLSPSTLHFWLPGIARALDFMHSSGVLHRDVKPGNIFLDGFLKPFLGDFGIAKVVDESGGLNREYTLTATRMAVGTPEYMAPELFRPGGNPDGRVDQYALAVTVYEMLAGRKPFRGDSAHIIVEHASKEAPPLHEFCPDAPASLVDAVHKGLAKNPEDRFVSCSQFAEAVLSETPLLNIDTSLARLLCPSCRAILRVSESTAGKRGTCPKCKSPVAVAQDLGSLWLGGEDRSTVAVPTESSSELFAEEVGDEKSDDAKQSLEPAAPLAPKGSPVRRSLLVAATLTAGFVLGSAWSGSGLNPSYALVKSLKQELHKISTARNSLNYESSQRAMDIRRLSEDVARLRDERDTVLKQSERLLKQNHRLIEAALAREKQAALEVINSIGTITNSLGIEFKLLPPGVFMMGGESDVTPHPVMLTEPFYMGVYEVTNAQWKQVMGDVPSEWEDDDHPVELVSWEDAGEFCRKLSALPEERKAGRVYRLPTEAEWEYACRAGTTTRFSFGNDESKLGEYGWFYDNSGSRTQQVGQKKPNAWGLFDMHGNVLEWCSDWYGNYPKGAVTDPQGPSGASDRVNRGGSCSDTAWNCRSAYRNWGDPSNRYNFLGFRLALSPSGVEPQEAGKQLGVKPETQPTETAAPSSARAPVAAPKSPQASLPTLTNSIGIKLKLISAGAFTMGQEGGDSDETPHQVTLTKPFYIGVYEVTNAQWKQVMGEVPSTWKDDARPVEQVSWENAGEFCSKLSALPEERKAGRVYRLPTEAEWEYACRAGTTTRFSFGNDKSKLGEYGWFYGNSGSRTQQVGQKKPNAWGLFDMHGNVWEWCSDWYGDYPKGAVTDPQGPSGASDRVHRGGGWDFTAGYCRSANRSWSGPSNRSFDLGFRLALSPSGVQSVPPEAGK